MKLIIDIDDNVFTRLFDNGVDTSSEDRKVIDRAVRNGIPYEDFKPCKRPSSDIIKFNKIKAIINNWAVDDDEHELLEKISDIVDEEAENE